MSGTVVVGYGLAVLSSVFNGIFAAPSRMKRVEATEIHPLAFNVWVSLGVFLSCLVSIPITAGVPSEDFAFPPLGLLAGALLVLAVGASFLAIQRVGLSLGQAVWGGSAVIVSFLWGSLGPDGVGSAPKNVGLSILGVCMIVLGIVVCVVAGEWSRRQSIASAAASFDRGGSIVEDEPLLSRPPENDEITKTSQSGNGIKDVVIGISFAASVGIFGGSILVPKNFLPKEQQQLAFIPAFGVGCLLACAVVFGIFSLVNRKVPQLHPRACAAPGIVSGILWNLGNYASIFAMSPLTSWQLPYAVAYPILQSAVIFSGVIGIFIFKEIQGWKPISTFFLGAAVVIGGCVMLGVFGPQG